MAAQRDQLRREIQGSPRLDFYLRQSTSRLICKPFVDTDDGEAIQLANEVLRARGYSRTAVLALRAVALSGVWWNGIVWLDDCSLCLGDILLGWAQNVMLLSLVAVPAVCVTVGWRAGLILLIVAGGLMVTLWRLAARSWDYERKCDEQAYLEHTSRRPDGEPWGTEPAQHFTSDRS